MLQYRMVNTVFNLIYFYNCSIGSSTISPSQGRKFGLSILSLETILYVQCTIWYMHVKNEVGFCNINQYNKNNFL
jgi:hypothetical protein